MRKPGANEEGETLERQTLNSNEQPEFPSMEETSLDKDGESPKNNPDQEDRGQPTLEVGDEFESDILREDDTLQNTP